VARLAAVEGVGLMFGDAYAGRRVLLTGHTGFKGSWLAHWLQSLGARVTGLGLDPDTVPAHFDLLRPELRDCRQDLRDGDAVCSIVRGADPEIVFHLAAQPLVRASYADPLRTWSTNVMGTAHLLHACSAVAKPAAIVVVTTDNCYENMESGHAYREDEPLGGHDPYSASKAAQELVAQSWRRAYFAPAGRPLLATARAGNVIGGGDWSPDRLVPDVARAALANRMLEVRSPAAVRPWQHVLDSLSGYLVLGQRLLAGDASAQGAWNFGPQPEDACTVEDLLDRMAQRWTGWKWRRTGQAQPHEAALLRLDITKAQQGLEWSPVWTLDRAVAATAQWYQAWLAHGEVRTREDLDAYVADAASQELPWATA
jgi:CDP-glucose 4,6-dehydratase